MYPTYQRNIFHSDLIKPALFETIWIALSWFTSNKLAILHFVHLPQCNVISVGEKNKIIGD